jgi:hypothetical protein
VRKRRHFIAIRLLNHYSYPWLVTEKGGALVFSYDLNKSLQNENEKDAGSPAGFEISLNDKR